MADIKSSNSIFNSDSMIESAQSLPRVRKEMNERGFIKFESDTQLFLGGIQVMSILMSLAIEIALKAWLNREREKNAVLRTHDFVKLFDELKASTKETLEARMRNLSSNSIWADQLSAKNLSSDLQDMLRARSAPLRKVLCERRDANLHWSHLYEKEAGSFESSELDRALTVTIDACDERWGAST